MYVCMYLPYLLIDKSQFFTLKWPIQSGGCDLYSRFGFCQVHVDEKARYRMKMKEYCLQRMSVSNAQIITGFGIQNKNIVNSGFILCLIKSVHVCYL